MPKKYIVTIDGAAGTGKSTSAGMLAERLGWLYVNSGYIYRAATLLGLRAKLFDREDLKDHEIESELVKLMRDTQFDFKRADGGAAHMYLNDEDVTPLLKSHEVEIRVSPVAQYMKVREEAVIIQRREAEKNSLVVEGRDTGTVVFPDADVKFYLTASLDVQADRQMKERNARGEPQLTMDELKRQIAVRDARDLERHLRKPEGAIEVNTDKINAEEVVNLLERQVRASLNL
ncbi:MAG: (d)CMP kinase [Candidatus Paceibacterota bacterium]|jgi:cytidylate kinase